MAEEVAALADALGDVVALADGEADLDASGAIEGAVVGAVETTGEGEVVWVVTACMFSVKRERSQTK